jgi:hypothetical protein
MSEKAPFQHQEPIFRRSPGEPVIPSSEKEKINFDDTVALEGDQVESNNPAFEAKVDAAMELIKHTSSEQEMQQILKEYNQQFEATNDTGRAFRTQKVGEVQFGDQKYYILETFGGTRSLTAEAIMPERTVEDFKQAWDLIKDDKQLKGILAFMARGQFNERDLVNVIDVENFYDKYPSITAYMEQAPIKILLDLIGIQNGTEKQKEYEPKAMQFSDIMFPGQ